MSHYGREWVFTRATAKPGPGARLRVGMHQTVPLPRCPDPEARGQDGKADHLGRRGSRPAQSDPAGARSCVLQARIAVSRPEPIQQAVEAFSGHSPPHQAARRCRRTAELVRHSGRTRCRGWSAHPDYVGRVRCKSGRESSIHCVQQAVPGCSRVLLEDAGFALRETQVADPAAIDFWAHGDSTVTPSRRTMNSCA